MRVDKLYIINNFDLFLQINYELNSESKVRDAIEENYKNYLLHSKNNTWMI